MSETSLGTEFNARHGKLEIYVSIFTDLPELKDKNLSASMSPRFCVPGLFSD
ncbi:MAG: hypothetical protein F6K31_36595 [Symploca sp. SIO2G7]|nr:hypothetical protein [Symploca sp. SIO2G7]